MFKENRQISYTTTVNGREFKDVKEGSFLDKKIKKMQGISTPTPDPVTVDQPVGTTTTKSNVAKTATSDQTTGITTTKSSSFNGSSQSTPKTTTLQSVNTGYYPTQKNIGGAVFRRTEKNDLGQYGYSATVDYGGKKYEVSEDLASQFGGNLVKAAKSLQDKDKTEFEKVVDETTTPEEVISDQEEVMTDAEEAKLKVDHYDYEEFKALGEEMGLDVSWLPESQDEFIEYYQGEKKKELDYLLKMNALQKEYADEEVALFDRQSAGAQAATTAGFAQGREGVMSATNTVLSKEFTKEMEKRRAQLIRQYNQAELSRQKAEADLKRAQREGDVDQIESYQARLQAAERDITQTKTQMIEAAALQTQTALNIISTTGAEIRANMESFTGMVDQGITFEPGQVVSMAETLRIPASVAMNYYNGAQAIRDDKTMDTQTKQIELADLKYDFTNKINGIRSEEAKKVNDFSIMAKSGNYTQEELKTMATAMNIPNDMNPLYQAELQLTQAEANIKLKEANGQPVTIQDKIDLAEAMKAYSDYTGGEVYVPTDSNYEVVPLGDGIYVNVSEGQSLDVAATDRDEGQCGAFVNDVLGIGVGSLYKDKTKFIDDSVIVPTPGMAFVKPIEGAWSKYGHTGIVEKVNADGTMDVVDANRDGDGKVHRYTMNITDVEGFIVPKKAEKMGGTAIDSDLEKYKREFMNAGMSSDKATEQALEKVEEDKKNLMTVNQQVEQNNLAINTIDNIIDNLSLFDTGLTGTVASWIPSTDAYDIASDLDTIKAIVGFSKLQEMRNASKTGGALGQVSEMENKLLQSVLGSLDQGQSRAQFTKNLEQVKESLIKINNAAALDSGEEATGDQDSPDYWYNSYNQYYEEYGI